MKNSVLCLVVALSATGCTATKHRLHSPLTHTGQATFAAIEEVVAKLNANPSTDWARVDIDALRAHLTDMDNVTMRTDVDSSLLPQGIKHVVTARGDALDSLHRMVMAHAAASHTQQKWEVSVVATPTGVTLEILTADATETARARALGFYGWLALGSHHQSHHWAMARGVDPHQH